MESRNSDGAVETDERWLLAQRVAESPTFERASQLRKLLLYICRFAILRPGETLREYDLALDVFARPADFDPATDNIVRSQVSHLRKKLSAHFLDLGRSESVVIRIPRGSYIPIFEKPATEALTPDAEPPESSQNATAAPDPQPNGPASNGVPWWTRSLLRRPLVAVTVFLVLGAAGIWVARNRPRVETEAHPVSRRNPFVRFLAGWEGPTLVIVPDASLVFAEQMLRSPNVSLAEYSDGSYWRESIRGIPDKRTRESFEAIALPRYSTFSEAMVASAFLCSFASIGIQAKPRFARDMRVSDFNEGNTVIIGAAASNPWASLFTDQINFRFVDDRVHDRYYFENLRPAPGEPSSFPVTYYQKGHDATGYVNVALVRNASRTGKVLLIYASDEQEAESATHLFLNGVLPPKVAELLSRKDLPYFEVFLRGRHFNDQSDDALDLVACRP